MPRPPLDYAADLKRRIKQTDERIAVQIAIRAKLAASYRLQSGDMDAYATASWQKDPVALDVSRVVMPKPSDNRTED